MFDVLKVRQSARLCSARAKTNTTHTHSRTHIRNVYATTSLTRTVFYGHFQSAADVTVRASNVNHTQTHLMMGNMCSEQRTMQFERV